MSCDRGGVYRYGNAPFKDTAEAVLEKCQTAYAVSCDNGGAEYIYNQIRRYALEMEIY